MAGFEANVGAHLPLSKAYSGSFGKVCKGLLFVYTSKVLLARHKDALVKGVKLPGVRYSTEGPLARNAKMSWSVKVDAVDAISRFDLQTGP